MQQILDDVSAGEPTLVGNTVRDVSINAAANVAFSQYGVNAAKSVGRGTKNAAKAAAGALGFGTAKASAAAGEAAAKTLATEAAEVAAREAVKDVSTGVVTTAAKKSIPVVGIGFSVVEFGLELKKLQEYVERSGQVKDGDSTIAYLLCHSETRGALAEGLSKCVLSIGANCIGSIGAVATAGLALPLEIAASIGVSSLFIAKDHLNPDTVQLANELDAQLANPDGVLSLSRVSLAMEKMAESKGNDALAKRLKTLREEKSPAHAEAMAAIAQSMIDKGNAAAVLNFMADAEKFNMDAVLAEAEENEKLRAETAEKTGTDRPALTVATAMTVANEGQAAEAPHPVAEEDTGMSTGAKVGVAVAGTAALAAAAAYVLKHPEKIGTTLAVMRDGKEMAREAAEKAAKEAAEFAAQQGGEALTAAQEAAAKLKGKAAPIITQATTAARSGADNAALAAQKLAEAAKTQAAAAAAKAGNVTTNAVNALPSGVQAQVRGAVTFTRDAAGQLAAQTRGAAREAMDSTLRPVGRELRQKITAAVGGTAPAVDTKGLQQSLREEIAKSTEALRAKGIGAAENVVNVAAAAVPNALPKDMGKGIS